MPTLQRKKTGWMLVCFLWNRYGPCPSLRPFCAYHLAPNSTMGAQASYSLELIPLSLARRWGTGLGVCRPGDCWPRARETQSHRPSIDGLPGFCAHSWFHCTPHYRTSPVYYRPQIYFHALDLMITTLSSCYGMKDGNGWIYTRTGSAWAQSSQRPWFRASDSCTKEESAVSGRVAYNRRRQRPDWGRGHHRRLSRKAHTGRMANTCAHDNPRCEKGADAVDLHARDRATSHRRSRTLG